MKVNKIIPTYLHESILSKLLQIEMRSASVKTEMMIPVLGACLI